MDPTTVKNIALNIMRKVSAGEGVPSLPRVGTVVEQDGVREQIVGYNQDGTPRTAPVQ